MEAPYSSFLLTPMCFEGFGECCSAVSESMKSWLCQNPDQHAVNNENAHRKILPLNSILKQIFQIFFSCENWDKDLYSNQNTSTYLVDKYKNQGMKQQK